MLKLKTMNYNFNLFALFPDESIDNFFFFEDFIDLSTRKLSCSFSKNAFDDFGANSPFDEVDGYRRKRNKKLVRERVQNIEFNDFLP